MSTRDAETLADLVSQYAGKGPGRGAKITFEQLADRSVDPESGYKPSANLLWSIAAGRGVKMNKRLVRAVAAGLAGFGIDVRRVKAAAAREYTGWDAGELTQGDDELVAGEVIQVARAEGVTPDDMPAVRAFFQELRRRRATKE
ncbi:hypothetical protein F9278_15730 [Streptomyces phaeolivaceus]|uniref:Uncharacterized protein n=1 Tax=Streptomyces phaeolivaceus TaxID=2653200 RepID=A0A5P8K3R2_9ACTN|nr:hypothetical protein [Streptomyces phaeolivaceus]QFQ97418.1 hypothetical protein F9278_15730 [Streptomyces phaeolivaceus]